MSLAAFRRQSPATLIEHDESTKRYDCCLLVKGGIAGDAKIHAVNPELSTKLLVLDPANLGGKEQYVALGAGHIFAAAVV